MGGRILEHVAPEVSEAAEEARLRRAEREAREQRFVTLSPLGDGRVRLRGILDNEGAAIVSAALGPLCTPRIPPLAAHPKSREAPPAAHAVFCGVAAAAPPKSREAPAAAPPVKSGVAAHPKSGEAPAVAPAEVTEPAGAPEFTKPAMGTVRSRPGEAVSEATRAGPASRNQLFSGPAAVDADAVAHRDADSCTVVVGSAVAGFCADAADAADAESGAGAAIGAGAAGGMGTAGGTSAATAALIAGAAMREPDVMPAGSADDASTAECSEPAESLPREEPAWPPDQIDDRHPGQRRADALVEVCRLVMAGGSLPGHGGDRPQLAVTVSYDALLEKLGPGVLDTGEPVSASTVRRIACDARVLPVVLGSASEVLDAGRSTRLVKGVMRRALVVRDRGCTFPACDRPARWCDAHHMVPWSEGGPTALNNLALLCEFHHQVVHADSGWEVNLAADGHPEFRPPSRVDPARRPLTNAYHRRT